MVPIASVIKLDDSVPLDKAALLGCGVTTGYGSAVRTGEVQPGDTVVVIGIGGIGINAVQGRRSPAPSTSSRSTRSSSSVSGTRVRRDPHVASSVDEAAADGQAT